jgi:hypothetical protein
MPPKKRRRDDAGASGSGAGAQLNAPMADQEEIVAAGVAAEAEQRAQLLAEAPCTRIRTKHGEQLNICRCGRIEFSFRMVRVSVKSNRMNLDIVFWIFSMHRRLTGFTGIFNHLPDDLERAIRFVYTEKSCALLCVLVTTIRRGRR